MECNWLHFSHTETVAKFRAFLMSYPAHPNSVKMKEKQLENKINSQPLYSPNRHFLLTWYLNTLFNNLKIVASLVDVVSRVFNWNDPWTILDFMSSELGTTSRTVATTCYKTSLAFFTFSLAINPLSSLSSRSWSFNVHVPPYVHITEPPP